MDIFILGGRMLEGVPPDASNRLYENNRDGTFMDVTKEAGLWDAGWAVGVRVGDFDNDGKEDLADRSHREVPCSRRKPPDYHP